MCLGYAISPTISMPFIGSLLFYSCPMLFLYSFTHLLATLMIFWLSFETMVFLLSRFKRCIIF